jgi:hypothetical protein
VGISSEAADRLQGLRRAKWAGALFVLVGGVGLLAFAIASGEDEHGAPPSEDSPAAQDGAARGTRFRTPVAPVVASPDGAAKNPRRPVRVRVNGPRGPEEGVLVRAIVTDTAARAQRDCSTTTTTDAEGLAIVEVDDPAPANVLLELARAEHGLRHAFVPLAPGAPEPVATYLPAGGRLSIVLEGAEPGRRAPPVTIKIFPPFGEWLALFAGVDALPAGDGGLQECNAVPRSWRFGFDETGRALVLHVPDDHAVLVEIEAPEGRIVESARYDGPRLETGDGDVLRVRSDATYFVKLREPPSARVKVVTEAGEPISGARVAVGFRSGGAGTRIVGRGETADAAGSASVPLWSGPRLPSWVPEGLVLVASAPGRGARVVEVKPAWYGVESEIALSPAAAGAFALEGTLKFENGKPVQGVPILLATTEPWNGHIAVDALRATTDGEGRWRLEVPEALRPVLAFGDGRLRVEVDAGRLEEMPRDALWRFVWPTLPRARMKPDALPFPAPRATARADGVLVLPP